MSQLYLIRHAQASFLDADYDRLSPQGEFQALRLGEYLAAAGAIFDDVIAGPRQRHVRSAELVREAIREAGRSCPPPVVVESWDEHQVDRLLLEHAPTLAEEHPPLRHLVDEAHAHAEPAERARRYQRLFEAIARLWIVDAVARPNVETWTTFRGRVSAALEAIVARPGTGRRVAVFTSVGPITVALQRALRCDDSTSLTTGFRLRNCSVTEFVFSGDRFTLDRFNALPHLPNPADWTYR